MLMAETDGFGWRVTNRAKQERRFGVAWIRFDVLFEGQVSTCYCRIGSSEGCELILLQLNGHMKEH